MIDLLPEGFSPVAAGVTVFASFFTSLLTAAFGLGGGLALLAIMGASLPPAAVVPVHGVAQLGANFSRFFLLRQHAVAAVLGWFALGCLIGAGAGALVFVALPVGLLRIGVGVFVLVMLWGPKPGGFTPGPASYGATGAVGSFLSMFFGATGPIVAAMLSATKFDRMQIVSTHAAAMVIQHGVKTAAFAAIGFAFRDWLPLIAAIVVAGAAGAWVGTKFLKAMPDARFQTGFRAILTAIAIYLMAAGARDLAT